MSKVVRTLTLLFLTVLAGCSVPDVPAEQPPDFLLIPAEALMLPTVETTEDIVQRAILSESAYKDLMARFNILITWFAETGS